MTEHEALTALVEWIENSGSDFTFSGLTYMTRLAREALDEADKQETLNTIGSKIDNISNLVEKELEQVPRLVTEGSAVYLQGYDTNGQFVSVCLSGGD